jgi:hypothetical protein
MTCPVFKLENTAYSWGMFKNDMKSQEEKNNADPDAAQAKPVKEVMAMKDMEEFMGMSPKSIMNLVAQKKIPMIRANGRKLFRRTRVLEALDRMSELDAS